MRKTLRALLVVIASLLFTQTAFAAVEIENAQCREYFGRFYACYLVVEGDVANAISGVVTFADGSTASPTSYSVLSPTYATMIFSGFGNKIKVGDVVGFILTDNTDQSADAAQIGCNPAPNNAGVYCPSIFLP